MVIAPTAGGQGFQFQMGEVGHDFAAAHGNVTGVVEDRHIRAVDPGGFRGLLVVVHQNLFGESDTVRLIVGIQTRFFHAFQTVPAAALSLTDDVQKDPVCIRIFRNDFPDLCAENVQPRRIEAEFLVVRAQGQIKRAVGRADDPVRMLLHDPFAEPGRDVNGGINTDLMAGIQLGAEQVELQTGVLFAHFCFVVCSAVMAGAEDRNGVNRCFFQRFLPLFFVERFTDPGEFFRCVKIKVYLTESHGRLSSGCYLFCLWIFQYYICRNGALQVQNV